MYILIQDKYYSDLGKSISNLLFHWKISFSTCLGVSDIKKMYMCYIISVSFSICLMHDGQIHNFFRITFIEKKLSAQFLTGLEVKRETNI